MMRNRRRGLARKARSSSGRKNQYNGVMQPWWQQPFFQVALPIIVAFVLTYWAHNRRIDDLNRRIDDLTRALNGRIDDLKQEMNGRIDNLKQEISRRLEAIERRLERIEQLLTDHDRRITALEERTSPLRR
jgi:hypothetical protein